MPNAGALEMVCIKCTFHQFFPARDSISANILASQAGWCRMEDGKLVCPKCNSR